MVFNIVLLDVVLEHLRIECGVDNETRLLNLNIRMDCSKLSVVLAHFLHDLDPILKGHLEVENDETQRLDCFGHKGSR